MIAKIDLVLERRLIDTGLDLVNTADFSLVSIQPYELIMLIHTIEQSTILPQILLS